MAGDAGGGILSPKGELHTAPPWVFFALTFAWSWTLWGWAALIGRPWTAAPVLALYVLGGLGPTLVAAALVHAGLGSEAPAAFWRRVVDVRRITPRWWLVLLGVAFLPSIVATAMPVAGGGAGGGEMADFGIGLLVVAVAAGFAEEPGWRGFVMDRLIERGTALKAALVVGIMWTLWHLPFYTIAGTVQSEAGVGSADFWSDMLTRIPLAVIFAWIYLRTGRAIASAVALHALDNLASVLFDPQGAQLGVRFAIITVLALVVGRRLLPVSASKTAVGAARSTGEEGVGRGQWR